MIEKTNVTGNSGAIFCYPPVLDACCGTRMMWFDKADSRALFVDIREESRVVDNGKTEATKGRAPRVVKPDQIADFRSLPFDDETFWHVVFDPPHLEAIDNPSAVLRFNYGQLFPGWREHLRAGFDECFRVLRPGGTLIFKWCESDIKLAEVLALTDKKPMYGHRSGAKARTHWVAFLKPPSADNVQG